MYLVAELFYSAAWTIKRERWSSVSTRWSSSPLYSEGWTVSNFRISKQMGQKMWTNFLASAFAKYHSIRLFFTRICENNCVCKQTLGTKILLMVQNFTIALEKSCLSDNLFVTLSSVAVSRQKGRSRVSKCFMWSVLTLGNQTKPMIALLRQYCIVKRAKRDFAIARC